MEPESPLPHSQGPGTCPYPEPGRSSPYPTSYFLQIQLNRILPSTPGSPKWSLSLRFPHLNTEYALPSPQRATLPVHLTVLDFITRAILGEKYKSLSSSFGSFLHFLLTSSPLDSNILLRTPLPNTLSLHSSLIVGDQVSHPYKTTDKIMILCILIFKFLDSKLEER